MVVLKERWSFIRGPIQCKNKISVYLELVLNMRWSLIWVVFQEENHCTFAFCFTTVCLDSRRVFTSLQFWHKIRI